MKKLLSIIICASMVLAGCSAGGGTAGTGATGDRKRFQQRPLQRQRRYLLPKKETRAAAPGNRRWR